MVSTKAGREAWQTMCEILFEGEAHDRIQVASAELGLSPGLMKTLFHLPPGDGVPMRDLADHWSCDASYVTNLADQLEERGLVERRPHATDRRIKTLVLTARGAAVRERAQALLYEPPSSLDALTATEQRALRDLLRKIAAGDAELTASRALAAG